jgi:hypothetical protein
MNGPKAIVRIESARIPTADIGRRGPQIAFVPGLMHCSNERPYSITSSARPSSVSGKVMPSALAVLRLTNSSTFVTCCTGRSKLALFHDFMQHARDTRGAAQISSAGEPSIPRLKAQTRESGQCVAVVRRREQ